MHSDLSPPYELRNIDERGQIAETTQPPTAPIISTPVIVVAALLSSGITLFVICLLLFIAHYLAYRKNIKISQQDPESGNDGSSNADATCFKRLRLVLDNQ